MPPPAQITGPVFVVRDNIDTDRIAPAKFLTLVPTIPEEYAQVGGIAMCGLPEDASPQRFVAADEKESPYPSGISGRNFGCGSSREHAPIAIGAAGAKAVVAETCARIFSATAWPPVSCSPSSAERGCATNSRPATKPPATSTTRR